MWLTAEAAARVDEIAADVADDPGGGDGRVVARIIPYTTSGGEDTAPA